MPYIRTRYRAASADHDRVRRLVSGGASHELLLGGGSGHHRELGELLLVGEHDAAERLAVEPAFRVEDARAPACHDLVEERMTGLLELARQHVGVDHVRAPLHQLRRDRRLPAADATGQPHELHAVPFVA